MWRIWQIQFICLEITLIADESIEEAKVWERGGTEYKTVRVSCSLFADDTTIVGEW